MSGLESSVFGDLGDSGDVGGGYFEERFPIASVLRWYTSGVAGISLSEISVRVLLVLSLTVVIDVELYDVSDR